MVKTAAMNIESLTQIYFTFDKPVPYKVGTDTPNVKKTLYIKPVPLKDIWLFLSSIDIFNIDKNAIPDVKVIQMSYLQFLNEMLIRGDEVNKQKFVNIMILCLGLEWPAIVYKNGKPYVKDLKSDILIDGRHFDDIRKIIMHQNIPKFDDAYINPELKKNMDEVDALKNKDYVVPSLERKMAIITSHTGLPKREQCEMTYRSFSLLFEEVCGEVEFSTVRPAILAVGSKKELEHWIFKKEKGKFDNYVKSVESYSDSIGGGSAMKVQGTEQSDKYIERYESFSV